MRIVHTADLHLGFSRYRRLTPEGINQREADVALSFVRAIDQTIALAPDVMIVAGDVFHAKRPSHNALVLARQQFRRLLKALPGTHVVMVAGNHEQLRFRGEPCVLRALEDDRLHVVDMTPERIDLPTFDLSVMCVPEMHEHVGPLTPSSTARYNVLVIHGEVKGLIHGSREEHTYDRTDLANAEFDYVALGHFHDYTEVAPRVFYSGAIDYTTSDTWHEAPVKGIISRDLSTGAHEFHPLPVSRPHIDLPVIGAAGLSPAEVSDRMRAAADGVGGFAGKVVRQVITNVPPRTELDGKLVRSFHAEATAFILDKRAEERGAFVAGTAPQSRYGTLRVSLEERLKTRPLADESTRESYVALGLAFFDDATNGATNKNSEAA